MAAAEAAAEAVDGDADSNSPPSIGDDVDDGGDGGSRGWVTFSNEIMVQALLSKTENTGRLRRERAVLGGLHVTENAGSSRPLARLTGKQGGRQGRQV